VSKSALTALVLIAITAAAFLLDQGFTAAFLLGLASSLSASYLAAVFDNMRYVGLMARILCRPRSEVRFSISYLLRIEVGGELLLIRGKRFPEQFQPVGGVYKLKPGGLQDVQKMGVRADNAIALDVVSSGDLRVRVPALSVPRFIAWFESGKGREIDPHREIYEELIEPGYLSLGDGKVLDLQFVKREVSGLRSTPLAKREVLIADIYHCTLTGDQADQLRDSVDYSEDLTWATVAEIEKEFLANGAGGLVKIAVTAKWLL
jgi:hypothetical protein